MDNYKTILRLSSLFLVILSIFFLVSINQKLNTASTTNTVSFSGEGKIVTKPDVAVAYLSITIETDTSKDAQDQNSAKSKAVVDFLKKQGIAEKDIKTTSYNIYPQYTYYTQSIYPPNEKPRIPSIRGYQVNQSLEVKIRDLDKVSLILDGVVTAGVNQISNLSFQIDDQEKFKAEARAKAIVDAKDKASTLKSQLGIKLGKIVNFSEGFNGYPPPIIYGRALEGVGGGGGPEVPMGENEIIVNVTITYQIK